MNFPEIPGHHIEKVLGAGGMAVVYLATHTTMGNKRAVKVMQPHLVAEEGFRGSFLNEGQTVAKLNHPNIVQIHDMAISGDICYMSMEYLDGGTLKDKLKNHAFSVEESIYILQQIGAGLNHAHKHQYIHRDIKPANILFSQQGAVKLADFGISKLQNISGDLTLVGLSPGTPFYMCPEQRNRSGVDQRCDIYSLGLVLYEMLTGQKVVHSDTNTQAIFSHTYSPVLPPKYQHLQQVLNTALAKKAEDRYATVPEFLNELIRESQPSTTPSPAPLPANDDQPTVIRPKPDITTPTPPRPSTQSPTPASTPSALKPALVVLSLALLAGSGWYAADHFGVLASLNGESPTGSQLAAKSAAVVKSQPERTAAAPEPTKPAPVNLQFNEPGKRFTARETKLDNMTTKVTKLLEMQPDSETASKYKQQILHAYYTLATDLIKHNAIKKSSVVIAKGLKLAPNDQQLTALKAAVDNPNQTLSNSQKRYITLLLKDAEQKIESGNQTDPKESSALEAYREILSISPRHQAATEGMNSIASALDKTISQHIKTDIAAANKALNQALEYFPFDETLLNYQQHIKARQQANE